MKKIAHFEFGWSTYLKKKGDREQKAGKVSNSKKKQLEECFAANEINWQLAINN